MDENKKKSPEEEEKKPPEAPAEEGKDMDKPDEPKPGEPAKPEEKAPDENQADENGEGAAEPEKPDSPDDKDEEILRLKTQIAAMQLGVKPDCMDDAVAIAESYVKAGKL
ncbi:MAG: hypothetical protein ACI4J2_12705 [Ruminococcus sp.]